MLTPPLLLADYAGYVDVSDRSEMRLRVTQQLASAGVPNAPQFGVDAFTAPQLRVRMTNRRLEYTFAYAPAVTVTDLQLGTGAETQLLQTGHLGVAWRADRHVTFNVNEDGSYGQFNSQNVLPVGGAGAATTANTGTQATPTPVVGTPAAPPAPMTGMNVAPLQAAPTPVTITLATTRTRGDVAVQANRQIRFAVGGGYASAGEVGTAPQYTLLPLEHGPSAFANLNYALSRHDFSITAVDATSTQFSSLLCRSVTGFGPPTALCRPLDQVVQLSEGYQHAFERRTALTVQAGVAYVRTRLDDDAPLRPVWLPTGLVSVIHSEGQQGKFITQAVLQLVPVINPFTGVLTNFIQGEGAFSEPISHAAIFRAVAGGGQAIPADSPAAATIVEGGVDLVFLINKQLDLAVGARSYWQRQAVVANGADANAPPPQTAQAFADFFSTAAYFAVTVRAPALRF